MTTRILIGDCRELLRTLPDESVHCVITSPPYWGLRDYGTATWEGGEAGCPHIAPASGSTQNKGNNGKNGQPYRDICGKCGARRIDSQLGLEPTPEAHVAAMVAVFREVRRILRKDGTLWLNYGDCYASSVNGRKAKDIENDDRTFRDKPFSTVTRKGRNMNASNVHSELDGADRSLRALPIGLKPKDLVGMPWRVAFALQADGWWLRQDIIWHKPNPMPESIRDRCTKAHEYLFLLAKSERYYFDAEAISELANYPNGPGDLTNGRYVLQAQHDPKMQSKANLANVGPRETRNKRSVWTVATAPFKDAHFATFPPELIEPCVKAGTSEKGCCAACGAPWVRVTEPGEVTSTGGGSNMISPTERIGYMQARERLTKGWQPSCDCSLLHQAGKETVPATVLDPFGGAGTTGLVADRLGRNAILLELNPTYAAMARARIQGDAPLFAEVAE